MNKLLLTLLSISLVNPIVAESNLMTKAQLLTATLRSACINNKKIAIPTALGLSLISGSCALYLQKNRRTRLNAATPKNTTTLRLGQRMRRTLRALEIPSMISASLVAFSSVAVALLTVKAQSQEPTAVQTKAAVIPNRAEMENELAQKDKDLEITEAAEQLATARETVQRAQSGALIPVPTQEQKEADFTRALEARKLNMLQEQAQRDRIDQMAQDNPLGKKTINIFDPEFHANPESPF